MFYLYVFQKKVTHFQTCFAVKMCPLCTNCTLNAAADASLKYCPSATNYWCRVIQYIFTIQVQKYRRYSSQRKLFVLKNRLFLYFYLKLNLIHL